MLPHHPGLHCTFSAELGVKIRSQIPVIIVDIFYILLKHSHLRWCEISRLYVQIPYDTTRSVPKNCIYTFCWLLSDLCKDDMKLFPT